jgi:hypothetical protein
MRSCRLTPGQFWPRMRLLVGAVAPSDSRLDREAHEALGGSVIVVVSVCELPLLIRGISAIRGQGQFRSDQASAS